MAASVQCPGCQCQYAVTAQLAGRKVKCKACGQVMQIPAFAPKPQVLAGGHGLDYDLDGALAMTAEQRKVTVLEPIKPPEFEHLPAAIVGALVAAVATAALAGILIGVGKQIELGIIAVVFGLIATIAGAVLFLYKQPLGGFSTHAGWTLASLLAGGITCFFVFTNPQPRRVVARADQPFAQVAVNLPPAANAQEQLQREEVQRRLLEMQEVMDEVNAATRELREEMEKREAIHKAEVAEARKFALVEVTQWDVQVDPRYTDEPPDLIAPEKMSFSIPNNFAGVGCLVDDEFGTSAILKTGIINNGMIEGSILEHWDFKTGKCEYKFERRETRFGYPFVVTAHVDKIFRLRRASSDATVVNLESYTFSTRTFLEESAPIAQESRNITVMNRGAQDSIILWSDRKPPIIAIYSTVTSTPRMVSMPTEYEKFDAYRRYCQSPGGRYLVVGPRKFDQKEADRSDFLVIDVLQAKIVGKFMVRGFIKPSVAFSHDAKELAVWCEEEQEQHSVAFIEVANRTVSPHHRIAKLPTHSARGRKVQFTRNGSHVIFHNRYLVSRKNPLKIVDMRIQSNESNIVFGEFIAEFSGESTACEMKITRLEGIPE